MKLVRTIRNCRPAIPVPCPKQWDALAVTAADHVRHCDTCSNLVYFCATDEQTLEHARAGHCIARALPDQSELGRIVVGRPAQPVAETPTQSQARTLRARERAIDDLLAWDLASYDRCCGRCGYPVPNFRKTCRVCGTIVGRAI